MNQQHVILHLSLIDGIGPSVLQAIINNKSVHHAWADLYDFTLSDFRYLGISEKNAQVLKTGLQSKDILEKELMLIEKHAINYCTLFDDTYPDLLKHIHMPPFVLYWYGASLNTPEKKIAVVGSRKASAYGERVVSTMVPYLVHHNITIVSGGALGLDSMAHQATLDAGGKTIAVFGSGLLDLAPRSNRKLFEQILDAGGSLVSYFPVQEEPYPGNFPARNRIISGLSNGTMVVQAAEKSGARITAQYALDQGRDVFAIPGPIDDELSVGCHRLIQDGAKLITHANDILIEYGITEPQQMTFVEKPKKTNAVKNKYQLGSIQDQILQICMKAHSIDDLAVQTKLSLAELQAMLFNLQLDGDIAQDFTGLWKVV